MPPWDKKLLHPTYRYCWKGQSITATADLHIIQVTPTSWANPSRQVQAENSNSMTIKPSMTNPSSK